MNNCVICGRETDSKSSLCQYHELAHNKLKDGFIEWKRRTSVDWSSYLERLYELDSLGIWIREVIELLMSQDGSLEL